MTTHPTLYKRTSTGAIQQWTISTDGPVITKVYGQVGGALQTATDTIHEGKNLGRSNATTPTQQAEAEALSQWQRKREKHYQENVDLARLGTVDATAIQGGVLPMLAHPYSKQGHKVTFPALVQPKFDGHRLIAVVEDGEATLWSRTQKPITGLPHVVAAIEALGLPDCVLDGEAYNHEYHDRFEDLTSFIRSATPKAGAEVVQYHVYDVVRPEGFAARHAWLTANVASGDTLRLVETVQVADENEMTEAFVQFLNERYEGLMIRTIAGKYEHKRSYGLQKVKTFDDAEFKITAVEEGRGRMTARAIFVCETATGESFRCKMAGSLDVLSDIFDDADEYVGQILTVKFQGLTDSGVPRFPIGLRLRQDL